MSKSVNCFKPSNNNSLNSAKVYIPGLSSIAVVSLKTYFSLVVNTGNANSKLSFIGVS